MSIMAAPIFYMWLHIMLLDFMNIEIFNRHHFLYWHYQIDFNGQIVHLKGLDNFHFFVFKILVLIKKGKL